MDSVVRSRPSFSNEEIREELRRTCLIDSILANFGCLTFEALFETINDTAEDPPFQTVDELADFVISRTNAFDVTGGIVSNHSADFREMFGYMVNYICSEDPEKRSVATIQDAVDKFKNVRTYEIGKTDEEFSDFLEQHPNFFILRDDFPSILNPVSVTIPSAWERCALPVYSGSVRHDKSIVLVTVGEVVASSLASHSVRIKISKGKWSGQEIYATSSYLKLVENVALKFPVGTVVEVAANRSYNTNQLWTAFSVIGILDEDSSNGEKKENPNTVMFTTECTSGLCDEFSVEPKFAEDLVRSELSRIEKLDDIIGFEKDDNGTFLILNEDSSFGEVSFFAQRTVNFKKFIASLYPLFEVVEHEGEEYIWLRGTYVPGKNVYIPYFIFNPKSKLFSEYMSECLIILGYYDGIFDLVFRAVFRTVVVECVIHCHGNFAFYPQRGSCHSYNLATYRSLKAA
uniref:Tudor domain-containing protein n=1 Tax=Syphacia muris TaxID=451379 RepID=A0A0N5AFH3_9BILA